MQKYKFVFVCQHFSKKVINNFFNIFNLVINIPKNKFETMTKIFRIDEFIKESYNQTDDRDKCYLANQEMRERFMKFIKLAEDDGWEVSVTLYDNNSRKGEIDIDCQKYSPAGQDFTMCLQTTDNEDAVFADLIEDYMDSYDPEEEAKAWSEESGDYDENGEPIRVGLNGAPQDWDDLVADMEACKSMVEDLERIVIKERI